MVDPRSRPGSRASGSPVDPSRSGQAKTGKPLDAPAGSAGAAGSGRPPGSPLAGGSTAIKEGVKHLVETYPGALHGFAVPDLPVFDQIAAERHWTATFELFREELSRPSA